MDDWSHLPSRNAVSEPAAEPQSTMTPEDVLSDSPGRVKRPQPAPSAHARTTRRLTRPRSPDNPTTKSGASPESLQNSNPHVNPNKPPFNPPTNVKNGQPPLDIARPFMDDIGAFAGLLLLSTRIACARGWHRPFAGTSVRRLVDSSRGSLRRDRSVPPLLPRTRKARMGLLRNAAQLRRDPSERRRGSSREEARSTRPRS